MIALAYGIKMWVEVSFVLSQFTPLTDISLMAKTALHRCSAIKSGTVLPLLSPFLPFFLFPSSTSYFPLLLGSTPKVSKSIS